MVFLLKRRLRYCVKCDKCEPININFTFSCAYLRMAADPDLEDSLLNGNGIHRILVWLLAGVAGEGLVHRQMIASDPRQAYAFLQMVRNR